MNFYFNSFSPASGESKVIVIVIVITFCVSFPEKG